MEETISLKEIFEVIKKRLLLIISLIVAAALIAAVVSYFVLTPTYESSSMFVVNQKEQEQSSQQFTTNEIQTSVDLINTYNVIIKSPAILEPVIDELGLDYSVGQLESNLNVSSAENSQVVTVTATNADPALATDIANTTVKTFQKEIPDILNVDNVSILSEAELSGNPSPVSPKPLLNIAIAVVLGGMIGVGLAFLLEYLDNTITTEKDLEDKIGVPVLGVISHVSDDDVQVNPFQSAPKQSRRGGDLDGAQEKVN
ncbi:capsular polysaccharide biosynthesis protein [Lentibacillus kapialis]|uniref:Capsular polysaccharide biosynthesis protein n=1 Tax=Lentibacillus kapialis TaxID=340214 RepID=A0A917UY41_9BACI|nr:Wzz/FepE/Etk N-terminal domain-containing protein [Lentibacillus kapialis]GGJ94995.1 capsular polysaccharide biosynthesis protein [Lentibacillus kapialis]